MRNANAQMPGFGNPNACNPMAGVNDPNEDRAAVLRRAWTSESDLREVYDTANRNNVAIYAVDPRGLPGFEFDINEGVGLQTDSQYLNSTMDTLRTLAENTDGRAIVNRNDLDVGMKQITRDSSAYYLIGYNSSQAPSDGKFHEIKVRVKRPGVQVRARKGYWALTPDGNVARTARRRSRRRPRRSRRRCAAVKPAVPRVDRPHMDWHVARRERQDARHIRLGADPEDAGRFRCSRGGEPARVSLMAVAPDGSPYFRGRVPDVALASRCACRSDRSGLGEPGRRSRRWTGTVARDLRRHAGQDAVAVVGRRARRRRCSTPRCAKSPCPI